ncbi:ras GEF [Metschnikowia bicuspidata var. bicuspidata NRRL YB-4993]|uniref:Ras GEF n=1 Tax=Metschnikowia bicuspidata var. bicuspidata NRRL YB-4993 TaxID=869754 RepID=A0A1A0H894_9ASCO|nr:ras GEF [Metschnikowia bicuspidata var. bicuspidata NRRL YB-4993]OBA20200.1 ras GEF [Metschnikowia bicuspidata var. bicuspidata NRRL YB-4993]
MGGLNISYTDDSENATATPLLENLFAVPPRSDVPDIDMSVLFIKALHSFDATQSQEESENSVCLSFNHGDLAFVHTIDDSGWGEVTLLETLDRGWIPMNFFSVAVNDEHDASPNKTTALSYAHYMGPLLDSCGKFLSNPISHTSRYGKKTFSIKIINSVRNGVRRLLQETDCLSRSNEIVIKKPIVRKCRKSLLSDWYTLMSKADEFKGTSNYEKIEILTLLVFQVTRRATAFFDVWARESQDIIKRDTEISLRDDLEKYPLLRNPPSARQRVAEINSVLYSYLSLIIGRLDLVEHNPSGCDLLETMVHHIILLLRELLFISKTGSDLYAEKPPDLDDSLDSLLSLVNQIVTGVKTLVINTLSESGNHSNYSQSLHSKGQYSHTNDGKALIIIAANMVHAIALTISCIRKTLEPIGDYKLSSERAYPDYSQIRISPEEFTKICSVGLVKSLDLNVSDLRSLKQKNQKSSNRYSTFRSGEPGGHGITANGIDSLHKAILVDTEASAPFGSGQEFKQYLSSEGTQTESESFTIQDELLVDSNGNLLGASFKGLIFTLTNETSPPEYFFVSAFFICFRNFASGLNLAELLIHRFECDYSIEANKDVLLPVKLRNRQKIICKMFQIWMESYWDYKNDHEYLSTLINFFNEAVFGVLPFEAMKLIEVASRLVTQNHETDQFISRNISLAKIKRKNLLLPNGDSSRALASRYSMVDGYELSKINTNSSVASSLKSMTLHLPLAVSGPTTATSSLLTKSQLTAIETLVITYRSVLRENWVPKALLESRDFVIADIRGLLPKWYALSDQNWVLSNYRPNLLDFNGLEIAKQLTLIESEIFCSIRASELVDGNFTAKKAHLKLAKNVRQSLLFTNYLSEYVVESVLQPQINDKVRVSIIKTWLKIAISCLYLRNFNSLAAIITSLQSHLITRLTRLWSDLSEKYTELYEYLCCIIHPEKNYNLYRTKLKSFLLSNEYNIPVVPYFSLFLQDLTFVTDGNPNYRTANTFLKQKLINIDKYLKLTRVIADIESLQIPYARNTGGRLMRSGTLFSLTPSKKNESHLLNGLDEYFIASVPALKELILLELWKISQVNKKEEDRAWKLSCVVQPRDTPQVPQA